MKLQATGITNKFLAKLNDGRIVEYDMCWDGKADLNEASIDLRRYEYLGEGTVFSINDIVQIGEQVPYKFYSNKRNV